MGQRNNTPLILLVLMALGISLRPAAEPLQDAGSSAGTARPKASPKSGPGQPKGPLPEGPMDVIRASFETAPGEPKTIGGKGRFQFLLVTVPDPSNSRYAYNFDTFSESIQRAASESDYIFDRFWLPWEPPSETESSGESDAEKERIRRERREQPGVMLFRDKKLEHPLVVFLISEIPTAGLNKIAFRKAVDYIEELNGKELPETIRIAGPSFSGTIPSLRLAIEAAQRYAIVCNRRLAFQVISGSATNASNAQSMKINGVEYHAMVENDYFARERFLDYLARRGVDRDRVAILSEAGTAFGQGFGQGPLQRNRAAAGPAAPSAGSGPLSLSFPMNIARLRNAYQEDPELRALWSGRRENMPKQGLEFKLKETGAVPDQIPAFSSDQTPVAQEIAISDLAVTIRRQRIRAVSVVATDILDAVFVAKLIQQNCPDVRLFAVDSDLLYQHASAALSFYGMLMATTYPLMNADQFWQPPPGDSPRLIPFRSQGGQGVYNACRFLLASDPNKTNLLEYSDPIRPESTTPPLWLTVVGREGFWPVRLLSNPGEPGSSLEHPGPKSGSRRATLPRPPLLWYLFLWLLTGAYLWHFLHVIYLGWRRSAAKAFPVYIELPDPAGWGPEVFAYLIVGLVAMLLAYLPLVTVEYRYLQNAADPVWFDYGTLAVATAVCAGILVFLLWWILRLRALAGWRWGIFALAVSVVVAGVYGVCWQHLSDPAEAGEAAGLFFTFRSLFPASGVCPVLPIAAVVSAISIWPFMRLQRLRYQEVRFPGYLDIEHHDSRFTGLRQCTQDLQRYIAQFPFNRRAFSWLVLGLLVLGFGLSAAYLGVSGLESREFDVLFAAAMRAAYLLVVLELIRMLRVWMRLRGVLDRLEWHPIRGAFDRLGRDHPELSTHAIWQRGSQKLGSIILVYSATRLRSICAWLPSSDCAEIERGMQQMLDVESKGRRENAKHIAALSTTLDRIAGQVVELWLGRIWRGEVPQPDPSNQALAARVETAEDLVALRFVALIRYVTVQLRNILDFVSSAFLLLLLAIMIYPFQPHRTLMVSVSILFAATAATVLFVFYQMDRNPTLSRLSGTEPGKVSRNFFISAFLRGSVPLVTLLASQFPQVGRILLTVLDPLLRAVH